jgi:thiamine-phosphate pyrophosphorylase
LHDFLSHFEPALAAADAACLLIDAPSDASDEAVAEIARPLNEIAQARGVATLLSARAALAKRIGADGVHLDLRHQDEAAALRLYREARNELGPDAIVGALCAPQRHIAMEIAELNADYLAFALDTEDAPDLIAWWAELMNAPCVAFGVAAAERASALADDGADFVAVSAALWSAPDPAGDLERFRAAIGSG